MCVSSCVIKFQIQAPGRKHRPYLLGQIDIDKAKLNELPVMLQKEKEGEEEKEEQGPVSQPRARAGRERTQVGPWSRWSARRERFTKVLLWTITRR